MHKLWTPEELEQLTILFRQKRCDEEISQIMGRTVRAVILKRRKLRLLRPDAIANTIKKSHRYTEEEMEFVRNFYRDKSNTWMSKKLGVSVKSYERLRYKMNLKKPETHKKGLRRSWHFKEEQFVIDHYEDRSCEDIAKMLGKTRYAVFKKARKLGLKKTYNPGSRGFQHFNTGTYVPKEDLT